MGQLQAHLPNMAVPWFRRSVAVLSQWRPLFDSRLFRMKFVMNKVALWLEFSLPALQFSPVSTMPAMLHTHLQLHVALTRTSRRRLGTSQKAIRTAFDSEVLSLSLICQTDGPWESGYTVTICIHPHPDTSFCHLISYVPFSGVQHAYTKAIYPWRTVVNERTASRDGAAGMPASRQQLYKTQHTARTHKPV